MFRLNQDYRILVEVGVNRYKLFGPGLVWLMPWQKILAEIHIAPQVQLLQVNEVQTTELVPVNVSLQVLYRITPENFSDDLARAMPYIVQWELLNNMHKTGDHQFFITDMSLLQRQASNAAVPQPVYQMQLPFLQEK